MSFLGQTDIRIQALQSPLDAQFDIWNSSAAAPLTFTFRFGSFDNQGWGFSGWTGFTGAEQGAMKSVLAEYESVANVKFAEVSDGAQADFDFGHVNLGWTGGQGGFSYSWSNNGGEITFDSEHYAVFSNGLDLSSASNRNLLLHEFGHAMTLKHPGNYDIGGGTPDGPFLPEAEDTNLNTVMSYHENPINGQFSDHLMPYDIAALQARFGANMSYRTGSDVYTGPDGNVQTIWDAGGIDSIDGGAFGSGVVIDLHEGGFSSLGASQNLAIAFGCVIENALGGAGADGLFGNAEANRLNGRGGADRMEGFGGSDTYIVDNALDVVLEAAGNGTSDAVLTGVSYVLAVDQSIERLSTLGLSTTTAINLTGNGFAQTLTGNAAANTLNGKGGADTMIGGNGDDTYVVDKGRDVVVEAAGEGTDRVLTTVSYRLGDGQSIQELSARSATSTTDISLTGNELAQTIRGNAGDNIISGEGGRDTLWGAKGADSFVFDTKLSASTNIDRILDFSVTDDTIRLDHDVFTALKVGALSSGSFEVGTHATEANDRIIYNSATGALFYDANGSASGGATQFATLQTGLHLTHDDFLIT
jgi:Ca2+-binding RTX toxin-like protein